MPYTQTAQIFASWLAFARLEAHRTHAHTNHFARKAKLYAPAFALVCEQLRRIEEQHPIIFRLSLTA